MPINGHGRAWRRHKIRYSVNLLCWFYGILETTVGSTTTSFTYRGDGLRVSQTTGSTTTSYTWDLNSSLPVVLDDGSQYVYGNELVSQVSATS
jgi:hypothetical protein